jgi:hypothetical protein
VPETPEQFWERARGGLRTPPVEQWDTWPFDGALTPRELEPPVDAEPPRHGVDGIDCFHCDPKDVLWSNETGCSTHSTGRRACRSSSCWRRNAMAGAFDRPDTNAVRVARGEAERVGVAACARPHHRLRQHGSGGSNNDRECVLIAVRVDTDHVIHLVCKHPDRSSVRSKGPMTPV